MKEIKRSKGTKEIDSIEASNPGWKDLSEGWYGVGREKWDPSPSTKDQGDNEIWLSKLSVI